MAAALQITNQILGSSTRVAEQLQLSVGDQVALAASDGVKAESQHDATSEAVYTLFAFLLAGFLIHLLKRRSPKASRPLAGGARSKCAQFGDSICTPTKAPSAPPGLASPACGAAAAAAILVGDRTGASDRGSGLGREARRASDALVAAVRAGRAAELPVLLMSARDRAMAAGTDPAMLPDLVSQLVLSSLRACAARRCFREALAAYRHAAGEIAGSSAFNAGGWSLLLYSAVEAGELSLCEAFFGRLLETSTPSNNDFLNIVRYYVQQQDLAGLRRTLGKLRQKGFVPEVITRNRALAVCVANKAFDLAGLLADSRACGTPMDTIAYNTIMKGWAQSGQTGRCFDLYAKMQEEGLVPSQVTFGILLDASIDAGDFDRVRASFRDIRNAGIQLNVVHYTTFIKGLVGAGELKDAMGVLEEMLKSHDTKPDLVTYSTLVKALADSGKVVEAIKVLERMLAQGITPDAIIFNIVLTGCCVDAMDSKEVIEVFDWLVKHGLRTTAATVSILLKAFACTNAFDEALELLEKARERLGLWPEGRHFAQLAQACAKEGCGARAMDAYAAMVRSAYAEGVGVDETSNGRLLRLCSSCGEAPAASRLYQAVMQAGGLLDSGAISAALAEPPPSPSS